MSRLPYRQTFLGMLVCLASAVGSATASGQTLRPLGHTIPAYIGFSDPVYEVAADEPNAVITLIRTGEYRQSVTVGFSTEDGSARAGQDYTAVSGELFIPAGVGLTTFTIPIHAADLTDQPATVQLKLWERDPETFIIQGDAVLNLLPGTGLTSTTPPALQIQAVRRGEITITWPADGFEGVLEKAETPTGGQWRALETAPELLDGLWTATEPASEDHAFYRLRAP